MNRIYLSFALFAALLLSQASANDKDVSIVMMGDSTTYGYGNRNGEKLTDFVQASLDIIFKDKNKIIIINAGKNGDTAKGALLRLDRDVFDKKPDVISLSFGLNDTGNPPAGRGFAT